MAERSEIRSYSWLEQITLRLKAVRLGLPRTPEALRRQFPGQHKKVIAYSLWGETPKYWFGALENIKDAKIYYPGWTCRFYVDLDAPVKFIRPLQQPGVEIVLMQQSPKHRGTFYGAVWRYLAADDPDVDIVIHRDCDSRLSAREVAAVEEWLASDMGVHIMRDHPYHQRQILGGMWGSRRGVIRRLGMAKMLEHWGQRLTVKGDNETFLAEVVYPQIKDIAFEHSEFNIQHLNTTRPFPTARQNHAFVGEIIDEHNRRDESWQAIRNWDQVSA